VCGKSVKICQNPIKTFQIKKRINTELFIDGKRELYIQELLSGPLRESCNNIWTHLYRCQIVGMKTHKTAACLKRGTTKVMK